MTFIYIYIYKCHSSSPFDCNISSTAIDGRQTSAMRSCETHINGNVSHNKTTV